MTSSPVSCNSVVSHFQKTPHTQHNVCDSTVCCCRCVYGCARVRACVCAVLERGVPLRLRCMLHSTGTPTLSRYIVDIRPLTSPDPLIHNIVSAARFALVPAGSASSAPPNVRSGAWRIALLAASSNPSPRVRWFGGLAPPAPTPSSTTSSSSSRRKQRGYDGERWHKAFFYNLQARM